MANGCMPLLAHCCERFFSLWARPPPSDLPLMRAENTNLINATEGLIGAPVEKEEVIMTEQKDRENPTLSEDQKGVRAIIEKLKKAGSKERRSDGSINVRIYPNRK